jgi:plastocyanin
MQGASRLTIGLVLVALIGACSSSTAAESPVATSSVDLPASYRFAPEHAAVDRGTTVTWTNRDHFTHSVQFLDGGLPTEPLLMEPGEAATFRFDQPGVFRYQCHLHPRDMQGSVTVAQ